MADMNGQVVLISGGARGQGAYEAKLLAESGAAVVLCDILDDEGAAAAAEIGAEGGEALYCHLDASDEASWKAAVDQALAWKGRLTGLVNNAGILNRTGTMGTSLEAWNRVIGVNLTGAFLGARHCAPAMRDAGGGSIVNIASVAAHVGHNDPAYSATKAGLLGLTRSMAVEFAGWKIRVNAICPGIIVTGLNAGGAHLEPWRRATPLGRYGEIPEAAKLVRFLLSDESSFITGEDIAIDGGLLAGGVTVRIAEEAGIDLTAS